jgi:pSer/pThr/pTyr-binding forkhead associated (FHA) protein
MPIPDVESFIDTSLIPEGGIGIRVAGTPRPYYLYIHKELIIGRPTDSDAALESVLDLSDAAAYAMGVSRRHAKIRRTATGFEVVDLDSRNGTWLNGERLLPNRPYPFGSGSQLRMGKLRLLVIYNSNTTPGK